MTIPDLSRGVIVVFSGGLVESMNPIEVRDRMDAYITAVNSDPTVQTASLGHGLTYRLFPWQDTPHLHHTAWRAVTRKLAQMETHPLIVVGHSYGGAAAVSLCRALQNFGKTVDLLWTCDAVATFDDLGDITKIPPNVALNLNSYTVPIPVSYLAPFPVGVATTREQGEVFEGILNIGLRYQRLPEALEVLEHRNAFYDLAGGEETAAGFTYPFTLLSSTLDALLGGTEEAIVGGVINALRVLKDRADVAIDIRTGGLISHA